MFKFLHAADVHLDSPLRGLERYEDAPIGRLRKATRRAFEALIGRAVAERVAFVVIAGDLYDGDWRDYNTGLFFVGQMHRLREAGIEVFLVEGNHDAASKITRALALPDNVHGFPRREAGTRYALDGLVAIHGQGFAQPAVTEELWKGFPDAEPGRFNLGVLHTSLAGRPGHEPYAPCTVDALRSKGYQYWALGHVHAREIVAEDPWIVFPGNTQGRHIREVGAKGCVLVTVGDGGEVSGVEPVDLDVLRWHRCEVDVADADTPEEALDLVERVLADALAAAEERALAVRVSLTGACKAHEALQRAPERWVEQVRAIAAGVGGEDLWVEKVKLRTSRPATGDRALERDDALGGLLRAVSGLEVAPEQRRELAEIFGELKRKLPSELLSGEDGLDPTDPANLGEPLEQARELLLARLLTPRQRPGRDGAT